MNINGITTTSLLTPDENPSTEAGSTVPPTQNRFGDAVVAGLPKQPGNADNAVDGILSLTPRAAKIRGILNQRHAYHRQVLRVRAQLNNIVTALDNMHMRWQDIQDAEAFTASLQRLAPRMRELRANVHKQIEDLDILSERYRRPTINIVMIGRSGKGKSLILRQISDLSRNVILDRGGLPVTGARSIIKHDPTVKSATALVEFYSEQELLTIIHQYYNEYALNIPERAPTSLDVFFTSLNDLEGILVAKYGALTGANANIGTKLNNLKRYRHINTPQLREHLRHPEQKLHVEREESIIHWIAQHVPDPLEPNNSHKDRPLYNYLVVKEVEITCSFHNEDVGEVALIDLMGTGETTLGADAELSRALKVNTDLALYVVKPGPKGSRVYLDQPEIDLYTLAAKAFQSGMPDLKLEEWTFLVVNAEDNPDECEALAKQILNPTTGMRFFGSATECDCSRPEAVQQKILEPLLDHMAKEVGNLDRKCALTWTREATRIRREMAALLTDLGEAIGDPEEDVLEEEELFRAAFVDRWRDLRLELKGLQYDLKAKVDRNEEDEEFRDMILNAIHSYQATPYQRNSDIKPLKAEFVLNTPDVLSFEWAQMRHDARTELQKRLSLDDASPTRILNEIKEQVVSIFRNTGGLSPLVSANANMEALSERVPRRLASVFRRLGHYQISTRDIIGYPIRVNLQRFDPLTNRDGWVKVQTPPLASATPTPETVSASSAPTQPTAQTTPAAFTSPTTSNTPDWFKKGGVLGAMFGERPAKEASEQIPTIVPATTSEKATIPSVLPEAVTQADLEVEQEYKHMKTALEQNIQNALDAIKADLSRDAFKHPYRCAYAALSDFIDTITYTPGVEMQWRNFYHTHYREIWPVLFAGLIKRRELRTELNQLLDTLTTAHRELDLNSLT